MKGTLYALTRNKNDIDANEKLKSMLSLVDSTGAVYLDGKNLLADSIFARAISAEAITTEHMKAGTIDGDRISAGTLDADRITANTITSGHISTDGLDAGVIKTGSISSAFGGSSINLNNGTFVFGTDKLVYDGTTLTVKGNINATYITGTIVNSQIGAGQITSGTLAVDAVTTEKIAVNTITAAHIKAGVITADHITAAGITADKIKAGTITAGTGINASTINMTTGSFSFGRTGGSRFAFDATTGVMDMVVSSLNIGSTPAATTSYVDNKTVLPVRYIRDWVNGSSINSNAHWVEIQAWVGTTNVASGKAEAGITSNKTLEFTYGSLPVLTDGSNETYSYVNVSSPDEPVYLQLDLGQIYPNLDSVKIWHYHGDGRTYYGSKTEVSSDEKNWYPIFDSLVEGTYPEQTEGRNYAPLAVNVESIRNKQKMASFVEEKDIVSAVNNSTSGMRFDGSKLRIDVDTEFNTNVKMNAGTIQSANGKTVLDLNKNTFNFDGTFTIGNSAVVSQKALDTFKEDSVDPLLAFVNDDLKEKWNLLMGALKITETDISIQAPGSTNKIQITGDTINFINQNVIVAKITGQQLTINDGVFLQNITLGSHKISKVGAGASAVTVFDFVSTDNLII